MTPCSNRTATKEQLSIKKLLKSAGREKRTVLEDGGPRRIGRSEYFGKDMACRLQGAAEVNKVTGMFHVTAVGRGYSGERTPTECDISIFNPSSLPISPQLFA